MSFVHGRHTVFKLDSKDLSAFTTTSQLERTSDSHDVTTYGKDSHVFNGGLLNGTATASGIYDNTTSTGPRAIIEPLLGSIVTLLRQPDGVGSGKAQDTGQVLVTKYVETSPVADMVTWSVDLQLSGDVDSAVQAP